MTTSDSTPTSPATPSGTATPTIPTPDDYATTGPAVFDETHAVPGSATPEYTSSQYTAPQYAAPQYQGPQPATVYPPARRTSILAVLTLVFGILGFGVVPVVTGHIALSQLKRTGEDGRGLALAGLILGYVTVAGWALAFLAWLGVAGAALLATAFGALTS